MTAPRTTHEYVVLAPATEPVVRKQLSSAMRTARLFADASPTAVVTICERMPDRGTVVPFWPIATVVSRTDPDSRGIVRVIDWSPA